MLKYSKIETLFQRDEETHKILPGLFRRPEFSMIKTWDVTEKIDGTNIRITFDYPHLDHPSLGGVRLRYGGRTDNAQIPALLLEYLNTVFTHSTMAAAFEQGSTVTLFGEGYGGKIQSGGNYRPDVSFRLFDVHIGPCDVIGQTPRGLWFRPLSVEEVAANLGIGTAPSLGHMSVPKIINVVQNGMFSTVAKLDGGKPDFLMEGVVARAPHGILDRMGRRIMFKLKTKDF